MNSAHGPCACAARSRSNATSCSAWWHSRSIKYSASPSSGPRRPERRPLRPREHRENSPRSMNFARGSVGSYTNSSGNNDGFLYSGGIYTTIDPPGSASTVAHGINASGKIVGYYTDNGANYHGFLDSGGVYTTIDPPASTYTIVNSINSYGQI